MTTTDYVNVLLILGVFFLCIFVSWLLSLLAVRSPKNVCDHHGCSYCAGGGGDPGEARPYATEPGGSRHPSGEHFDHH